MNRIESKFLELKEKGEKALIPYITIGNPTVKKTEKLVYTLEENGADLIQLGIPYSDPLADGTIIESEDLRSIANGFRLQNAFACVKNIRKHSQIPLIFMCYYNSILGCGAENFVSMCVEAGVDGIIIPDIPMEEKQEIVPYIKNTGMILIPIVAVTSKERTTEITKDEKGFVCCVASAGADEIELEKFYKYTGEISRMPVCADIESESYSEIKNIKNVIDGVILGTVFAKELVETNYDLNKLGNLTKVIKEILHSK